MYNIKEIQLLFSTLMVQAILEGRKTQTRRTRRLNEINEDPDEWELCWIGDTVINKNKTLFGSFFQNRKYLRELRFIKSPYGKPGDLLWVREKTIRNNNSNTYWPVADGYLKTSDYEKTTPSIHMPKSASRRWLMVEEIRVERLQDISDKDAKSEGSKDFLKVDELSILKELGDWIIPTPFGHYQFGFLSIWVKINGPDSWKKNPWVWVVKFRTLSTTGRPSDEVIEENYKAITEKEVVNG